jgi:UDP-N-acetylglucosamine transferase subunit ALG13
VIFLTVGTQLPFDRLVAAVDAWAWARGRDDVFGQISDPGPAGYRPKHFDWVADLDPIAFEARFRAASHIVAHAGMGTIIGALGQGKPLLIVPRRAHLGEQRNDHQFATARRFGTRPGILVAFEAEEVPARIDALLAGGAAAMRGNGAGEGAGNGPGNGPGNGAGNGAGEGAGNAAGDGAGGTGPGTAPAAPIARFAEKRLTEAIRAAILN